MRCVSCGTNIPPEWVAAIESNVCPGCGNEIMSAESQEFMQELSDAIARMPNDPQGLAGWLMSTYRFKKIGDVEPVEKFHRAGAAPQQQQAGGGEEQQGIKHAANPYQELLERTHMASRVNAAQAAAQSNREKIATMKANIGALPDPHDPVTDTSNEDIAAKEDYEAARELMESGIDPFNPANNAPNAQPPGGGQGALTADQIMAIQKQASASADMADAAGDRARSNVGYNDDGQLTDAEKLLIQQTGQKGQEVIHNQRARRIRAQSVIDSGEISHPQGFTRSG